MTGKYRSPLLYIEVIDVSSLREAMQYEPIDQISFLYQSKCGPKREHQNIVTL